MLSTSASANVSNRVLTSLRKIGSRGQQGVRLVNRYAPCRYHHYAHAGGADGALRLVSVADVDQPPGSSSGRVEVCLRGQWGAVCGDSRWGYEDAKVACRYATASKRQAAGEAGVVRLGGEVPVLLRKL